jgi:hypothetical protein
VVRGVESLVLRDASGIHHPALGTADRADVPLAKVEKSLLEAGLFRLRRPCPSRGPLVGGDGSEHGGAQAQGTAGGLLLLGLVFVLVVFAALGSPPAML